MYAINDSLYNGSVYDPRHRTGDTYYTWRPVLAKKNPFGTGSLFSTRRVFTPADRRDWAERRLNTLDRERDAEIKRQHAATGKYNENANSSILIQSRINGTDNFLEQLGIEERASEIRYFPQDRQTRIPAAGEAKTEVSKPSTWPLMIPRRIMDRFLYLNFNTPEGQRVRYQTLQRGGRSKTKKGKQWSDKTRRKTARTIHMKKGEYLREHHHLFKVLQNPTRRALNAELRAQKRELKERGLKG